MSVDEIKKAIYELSLEERQQLIGSLVPRQVRPTREECARIEAIIEKNNAEDTWVSWEELKAEAGN